MLNSFLNKYIQWVKNLESLSRTLLSLSGWHETSSLWQKRNAHGWAQTLMSPVKEDTFGSRWPEPWWPDSSGVCRRKRWTMRRASSLALSIPIIPSLHTAQMGLAETCDYRRFQKERGSRNHRWWLRHVSCGRNHTLRLLVFAECLLSGLPTTSSIWRQVMWSPILETLRQTTEPKGHNMCTEARATAQDRALA